MGVEDGELVAVVLEEPQAGIGLELETVRRRGGVATALVALRDAVAHDDEPARLVRLLGARVSDELGTHLLGDHHQSVRSMDCSTSSAFQKSALRYFQPASASTQTTTPSSSSAARVRATCTTAPDETPANMPSASSSARTARTESSFETSSFRSSFETSRIGGM